MRGADTAVVRNLGKEESRELDPPSPAGLLKMQAEYPEAFLVHARNGGLARAARNLNPTRMRGSRWNLTCD